MAIQPFTPPQFGTQQTEAPQVKKQKGTGFTNIGQMLQANIGAGKQMAQQVGKNVGLQAGKVAQDVTKSTGAFQKAYGEAREAGEKKLGDISKLVGQVEEGGVVGAGLSGLSEEQAKEFGKQFAETKYTGPMGLEGDILKRAEGLKGLGQALTSGQGQQKGRFGGQGQLIGSTLARTGPYTMGQSLLDTALIGQDVAAQNALRSAALEAMKTSGMAQSQEAVAKQQAQMAQQLLGGDKESGSLRSEIQKSIAEKKDILSEQAAKQTEEYYKEAKKYGDVLNKVKLEGVKSLSKDEVDLLQRGEEFGVSGQTLVDPRSEALIQDILSNVSLTGALEPGGALYYSPEQTAALRNLQLIKQEKQKIPEFSKDIYSEDKETSEKKLKSYHSENLAKIDEKLKKAMASPEGGSRRSFFEDSISERYIRPEDKSLSFPMQKLVAHERFLEENYNRHKAESGEGNAYTNASARELNNFRKIMKNYRDEVNAELKKQQVKTTLDDYLKSLDGKSYKLEPDQREGLIQR